MESVLMGKLARNQDRVERRVRYCWEAILHIYLMFMQILRAVVLTALLFWATFSGTFILYAASENRGNVSDIAENRFA